MPFPVEMKIALVHYAYTPVIGGVEFVLEQHAGLFRRRGHEVKVVCGTGRSDARGIEVVVVPDLLPGGEACAASQEALQHPGGASHPAFTELRGRLRDRLRHELAGCDRVFVHNVLSMHFNLAATAALADLAAGPPPSPGGQLVNWVHDAAAANPDYHFPQPDAFPWTLMREAPDGFGHVCISARRQAEYCRLTGLAPERCPVVPNGVEHLRLLRLTPHVRDLVRRHGVLYRDIVILHPTRILRRKNIELGIRVAGALKALGAKVLYLVTGAPDPHNPASREYGAELRRLILDLGLEEEALFLGERFPVGDDDLANLFAVSDLLFLPSRQEGFGLPLLEAALFRLPAFCPAIEPMQSILKHNVHLFGLDESPERIAVRMACVLRRSEGFLSRKEVMRKYSWDRLYEDVIAPMFLNGPPPGPEPIRP